MKKYYIVFTSLAIILSLSGCSISDNKTETKINNQKENKKSEKVSFNKSVSSSHSLDKLKYNDEDILDKAKDCIYNELSENYNIAEIKLTNASLIRFNKENIIAVSTRLKLHNPNSEIYRIFFYDPVDSIIYKTIVDSTVIDDGIPGTEAIEKPDNEINIEYVKALNTDYIDYSINNIYDHKMNLETITPKDKPKHNTDDLEKLSENLILLYPDNDNMIHLALSAVFNPNGNIIHDKSHGPSPMNDIIMLNKYEVLDIYNRLSTKTWTLDDIIKNMIDLKLEYNMNTDFIEDENPFKDFGKPDFINKYYPERTDSKIFYSRKTGNFIIKLYTEMGGAGYNALNQVDLEDNEAIISTAPLNDHQAFYTFKFNDKKYPFDDKKSTYYFDSVTRN